MGGVRAVKKHMNGHSHPKYEKHSRKDNFVPPQFRIPHGVLRGGGSNHNGGYGSISPCFFERDLKFNVHEILHPVCP